MAFKRPGRAEPLLGPWALLAVLVVCSALTMLSTPARERTVQFVSASFAVADAQRHALAVAAQRLTVTAVAAADDGGEAPPGLPPDPMKAAWLELNRTLEATNSSIVSAPCDAALASKFAAAPWLLPPNCSALPYQGIHDFDTLLQLRGRPAAGYEKAIALMPFDTGVDRYTLLSLNTIYSLVRLARVDNFMLWTWTNTSLADCAALNLPCADGRPHLLEPQGKGRDVIVAMWLKPVLTMRALRAGYMVLLSDGDVAFSGKPMWDLLTQLALRSHADLAVQAEQYRGPAPDNPSGTYVNSGLFLALPTPASIRAMEIWLSRVPVALTPNLTTTDQHSLHHLERSFHWCRHAGQCLQQKELNETVPRWRLWVRWNQAYDMDDCRISSDPLGPKIDPCDAQVLAVHPLCGGDKAATMKRSGFWFLDDCLQRNGSAVQLPSCPPLQWRLPDTETRFFACGQRSLTQLLEYLGVPAPFPSPLPLPPPLLHLPPANAPAPAPAG